MGLFKKRVAGHRGRSAASIHTFRPNLESLEGRDMPSGVPPASPAPQPPEPSVFDRVQQGVTDYVTKMVNGVGKKLVNSVIDQGGTEVVQRVREVVTDLVKERNLSPGVSKWIVEKTVQYVAKEIGDRLIDRNQGLTDQSAEGLKELLKRVVDTIPYVRPGTLPTTVFLEAVWHSAKTVLDTATLGREMREHPDFWGILGKPAEENAADVEQRRTVYLGETLEVKGTVPPPKPLSNRATSNPSQAAAISPTDRQGVPRPNAGTTAGTGQAGGATNANQQQNSHGTTPATPSNNTPDPARNELPDRQRQQAPAPTPAGNTGAQSSGTKSDAPRPEVNSVTRVDAPLTDYLHADGKTYRTDTAGNTVVSGGDKQEGDKKDTGNGEYTPGDAEDRPRGPVAVGVLLAVTDVMRGRLTMPGSEAVGTSTNGRMAEAGVLIAGRAANGVRPEVSNPAPEGAEQGHTAGGVIPIKRPGMVDPPDVPTRQIVLKLPKPPKTPPGPRRGGSARPTFVASTRQTPAVTAPQKTAKHTPIPDATASRLPARGA